MRYGITILPEQRWSQTAPRWRRAEELGFDHAWTYDHLVWAGLPDVPWFGTMPTLTAAALVTSRIKLGTFVSSPNYRHPYVYFRDLMALDDISGGRVLCGLGTGGDLDSRILGEDLTLKERVSRFHEFVRVLDRLQREDHVDHEGDSYRTVDARTLPGPVQQPRVPFIIAANGPKSLALAAELGQGWVTYGKGGDTEEAWWAGVAELVDRLEQTGTPPADRYLNVDAGDRFALESVDRFADVVGRAEELGFTDVVTHWPRSWGDPGSSYAGTESVLDEVAARFLSQP